MSALKLVRHSFWRSTQAALCWLRKSKVLQHFVINALRLVKRYQHRRHRGAGQAEAREGPDAEYQEGIEDDVRVTKDGNEVLTQALVKSSEDIEALMATSVA